MQKADNREVFKQGFFNLFMAFVLFFNTFASFIILPKRVEAANNQDIKIFKSTQGEVNAHLPNAQPVMLYLDYYKKGKSSKEWVMSTREKLDENDTLAYCLNHDMPSPHRDGNKYRKTNERLTDLEYSVLQYGHGGDLDQLKKFGSGNDPKHPFHSLSMGQRYYVTQMALYVVSNDKGTSDFRSRVDEIDVEGLRPYQGNYQIGPSDPQIIKESISLLVNHAKKHMIETPKVPKDYKITIEGSKAFYDKGDYYESDLLRVVDSHDNLKNLKISTSLGDAKFVDESGNGVSTNYFKTKEQFRIRISKDKLKEGDKKVGFSLEGKINFRNVHKYEPIAGEKGEVFPNEKTGRTPQRMAWIFEDELTAKSSFEMVFPETDETKPIEETPKVKDLQVHKLDQATEEPLQGAVFELYKGDKLIDTKISNQNGVVRWEDLEYGDYTIKEKQAPKGFAVYKWSESVTLHDDGNFSQRVKFYNVKDPEPTPEPKKYEITILKEDAQDGLRLEGAKFKIFDSKNVEVAKGTTNKDGIFEVPALDVGTYTLKEIEAPKGYEITKKEYQFTIKETDNKDVIVKNNPIKGEFELTKYELGSTKPLPNTKFVIKNSDTGEIIVDGRTNSKGVTDSQGKIKIHEIPYGNYTYQEVEAPEGYVIDETERFFSIANQGEIVKVKVDNKPIKGSFELTKKDVSTGEPLEGVDFEISLKGGHQVFNGTTNKDGKIKVDNLVAGTYLYKEINTIDGYVLDPTPKEFKILKDGDIEKATVTNKHITGQLKIIKKDAKSNEPIENVEFTVFKRSKDKDIEVQSGKTNKEGILEIKNLPYGHYYFKETKSAKGYVFDSDNEYPFTISEEGEIIEEEVLNQPIFADVVIVKQDLEDDSIVLPAAKFEILNDKGQKVYEGYTDEKGEFKVENLPYGKYTYKEIEAPNGYILDDQEKTFEIKEYKNTVKLTHKNEKIKGDLELTKTDITDGKLLPYAKFKIRDSEGNVIREGETDQKGVAYFKNLPYGKYTYQEYDAPQGYIIDESEYEFEIKENGEIVKAHMTNIPVVSEIKVVKVDEQNNDLPIPNITFGLFKTTKEQYEQLVKNGGITKEINERDVDNGSLEKPASYDNSKATSDEEVKENNKDIVDEVDEDEQNNKNSTIVEEKETSTQTATKRPVLDKPTPKAHDESLVEDKEKSSVPLAEQLVDVGITMDDLIEKIQTDEDGLAKFKDLTQGYYVIKEIDTTDGYYLNENIYLFESDFNGGEHEYVVTNKKVDLRGNIELTKIDAKTKKPLKDVVFELIDKTTNKKLMNVKTNQDGQIIVKDLHYGQYEFVEIKAPKGYEELTDGNNKTNVILDSDLERVTVENHKKPPVVEPEKELKQIQILKVDEENNELAIEGATFSLFKVTEKDYALLKNDVAQAFEIKSKTDEQTKQINNNAEKGKIAVKDNITTDKKEKVEEVEEVEEVTEIVEADQIDETDESIEVTDETEKTKETNEVAKETDKATNETDAIKFDDLIFSEKLIELGITQHDIVDSVTTDQKGIATFKNIDVGFYIIQETKAPKGYILDDSLYYLDTNSEDDLFTRTITNQKIDLYGDLLIKKVDGDTGELLEGAHFNLVDLTTGKTIDKFKTDQKGQVLINGLPYGQYQLLETKVPKGYVKPIKGKDVTNLKVDSKQVEIIIKNYVEPPVEETIPPVKEDIPLEKESTPLTPPAEEMPPQMSLIEKHGKLPQMNTTKTVMPFFIGVLALIGAVVLQIRRQKEEH